MAFRRFWSTHLWMRHIFPTIGGAKRLDVLVTVCVVWVVKVVVEVAVVSFLAATAQHIIVQDVQVSIWIFHFFTNLFSQTSHIAQIFNLDRCWAMRPFHWYRSSHWRFGSHPSWLWYSSKSGWYLQRGSEANGILTGPLGHQDRQGLMLNLIYIHLQSCTSFLSIYNIEILISDHLPLPEKRFICFMASGYPAFESTIHFRSPPAWNGAASRGCDGAAGGRCHCHRCGAGHCHGGIDHRCPESIATCGNNSVPQVWHCEESETPYYNHHRNTIWTALIYTMKHVGKCSRTCEPSSSLYLVFLSPKCVFPMASIQPIIVGLKAWPSDANSLRDQRHGTHWNTTEMRRPFNLHGDFHKWGVPKMDSWFHGIFLIKVDDSGVPLF